MSVYVSGNQKIRRHYSDVFIFFGAQKWGGITLKRYLSGLPPVPVISKEL